MGTLTLIGICIVALVAALFLLLMIWDGIQSVKASLALIKEWQQTSARSHNEQVRVDRATMRNIHKLTEEMHRSSMQGRIRNNPHHKKNK